MGRLVTTIRSNGYLKLGSSGSSVVILQKCLAAEGYPLKGTGTFGPATDSAVTDVQRRLGLSPDGIVGEQTALAIEAANDDPELLLQEETPGSKLPTSVPLWVTAGMKYIGLKEGEGAADNPEVISWAKSEGGAIAASYAHDSIAWCALFANMLLTKVGLKGTETLWALDWDTNKWPNTRLEGPAVGAFMPMKRTGGGHITVCVGKALVNGEWYLMGLGGNQGDSVSIAAFPKGRPLSYRWPSEVLLPTRIGFDKLPVINAAGKVLSTQEG